MSNLLIMLAIIFGIFALIFAVMTISRFGTFMLNWADSSNNVPDWISANSFLSWVLFLLALLVVAWVIRFFIRFVSSLLLLPADALIAFEVYKNGLDYELTQRRISIFILLDILVSVGLFVLIVLGTAEFFTFASSRPDLSAYYTQGGTLGIIVHSLVAFVILFNSKSISFP